MGKTADINEEFERLLAGKTIDCIVNDNLPYHKIHENGDNIWSALLETGYLTKASTEKMLSMALKIPNREITEVFRSEVWEFFKDRVENAFVKNLVQALWSDDTDSAEKNLNQILEATLSFYHEYHEYSYHLILDGFFTGHGYKVLSELEMGYGRSDLVILDSARNRCLILELKHVENEKDLNNALNQAEMQLVERKYESFLKYHGYDNRIKYGMVFYGKKAVVSRI